MFPSIPIYDFTTSAEERLSLFNMCSIGFTDIFPFNVSGPHMARALSALLQTAPKLLIDAGGNQISNTFKVNFQKYCSKNNNLIKILLI